jgi:hypothetical protein
MTTEITLASMHALFSACITAGQEYILQKPGTPRAQVALHVLESEKQKLGEAITALLAERDAARRAAKEANEALERAVVESAPLATHLARLLSAADDAASRLGMHPTIGKGCDLMDALLNYRHERRALRASQPAAGTERAPEIDPNPTEWRKGGA